MTVSVIIPVRNMADTLPRAVESALTAGAQEVIIIYDASSDDTYDVACNLTYAHDTVYLIHPKSLVPIGVCAARNIGISQAIGDCIIPLDADDYFMADGIQLLTDAWRPGTFVYGGYEKDDGTRQAPPPFGMLARKNITQATFLFTKTDWLKAGGYNPVFNLGAEDYALMRALVRAGVTGTRIEPAVYHYTDHTNGRAAACQRRWPLVQQLLDELCPLP